MRSLITERDTYRSSADSSPIVVSDGSVKIARHGHFNSAQQPAKDYWVLDAQPRATYIEVLGCPSVPLPDIAPPAGCAQQPSPSLLANKDWKLALNDGTIIAQDLHNANRINITLSTPVGENHANNVASLTPSTIKFTSAILSGQNIPTVIYGCPQVNPAGKCVPVIYYCAKNGIRD